MKTSKKNLLEFQSKELRGRKVVDKLYINTAEYLQQDLDNALACYPNAKLYKGVLTRRGTKTQVCPAWVIAHKCEGRVLYYAYFTVDYLPIITRHHK